MSTKIYEAYRIPLDRLNEFISYVRPQMMHRVGEYMYELMIGIKNEVVDEIYRDKYPDGAAEGREENAKLYIRLEKVEEMMKEDLIKRPYERSIFDPVCGLNIWILDQNAYIIPVFTSLRGLSDKIDYPDFAFDYSYWNNTDQPENVTDEDWEKRRDTWEELCLGDTLSGSGHNSRRLYHDVISVEANGGPCFDFHWFMKKNYCDIVRNKTNV